MSKDIFKKIFSGPNNFSKLGPVIFVVIFAGMGGAYLLITHAASINSVNIQSSANYKNIWYKTPADLLIEYSATCRHTQVTYPLTAEGQRTYYVWQDSNGNPYVSVNAGQPVKMGGVDYCSPNNSYTEVWKAEIGIDTLPPTASFTSTNSTTQSSSIIVTGVTADTDSGVSSVKVNGVAATLSSGHFTATVPLNMGANSLIAVATDNVGRTANSGALTITRVAPPAPPPAPPPSSGGSGSSSSGGGKSSSSKSTKSSSTTSSSPAPATTPTDTSTTGSTDQTLATTDVAPGSSPNVPADTDSSVTSIDGLVSISFPSGAFGTDAYCTINPGDSNNLPDNSSDVIGPYTIDCSDSNGNTLDKPKKDLTVTVNVSSNGSTYSVYTNSNNTWSKIPSTLNKDKLQFKLASTKLFAITAAKKSSKSGLILNIIGAIIVILIIGGGIAFVAWRRQQQDSDIGGGY